MLHHAGILRGKREQEVNPLGPQRPRRLVDDLPLDTEIVGPIATGGDRLVVEFHGLEAQRGGILEPQARILEHPGMRLVLFGEHEVALAVRLPDRGVPGAVGDVDRFPVVAAVPGAVEPHWADQVGGVPRVGLHGTGDILPRLNHQRGRLRAVGRCDLRKQRVERCIRRPHPGLEHRGIDGERRGGEAVVLLDANDPLHFLPADHLLVDQAGKEVFEEVERLVEGVVELAEHRDAAFLGHLHESPHAEIGFERAVVEGIDLVAARGVEHESEVGGLHIVEDRHHLPLGKLPRLPPQPGVRPHRLHCLIEHVEKGRQAGVERYAAATRAGTELAAEPRLLVERVDEHVVDLWERDHELLEEVSILRLHGLVEDAGRPHRVEVHHSGNPEVGDRLEAVLLRLRDAELELLALLGIEVLEIQNLARRLAAPGDRQLHHVDAELLDLRQLLVAPGNVGHRRVADDADEQAVSARAGDSLPGSGRRLVAVERGPEACGRGEQRQGGESGCDPPRTAGCAFEGCVAWHGFPSDESQELMMPVRRATATASSFEWAPSFSITRCTWARAVLRAMWSRWPMAAVLVPPARR